MNIEEFRDLCLSLPGARDRMPFTAMKTADRDIMVFDVAGKWFCFVNILQHEYCCLKCDPAEGEALRESYEGVRPGYHMNKRHWISVCFDSDVPDSKIRELVRKAHSLAMASLPRRLRDEINAAAAGPQEPL